MLSASLSAGPLLSVAALALLVALAWGGTSPTAAPDGKAEVPGVEH